MAVAPRPCATGSPCWVRPRLQHSRWPRLAVWALRLVAGAGARSQQFHCCRAVVLHQGRGPCSTLSAMRRFSSSSHLSAPQRLHHHLHGSHALPVCSTSLHRRLRQRYYYCWGLPPPPLGCTHSAPPSLPCQWLKTPRRSRPQPCWLRVQQAARSSLQGSTGSSRSIRDFPSGAMFHPTIRVFGMLLLLRRRQRRLRHHFCLEHHLAVEQFNSGLLPRCASCSNSSNNRD